VIEVGGGDAPLYPGGYEDFLYWKRHREAGLATPGPPAAAPRRHEEEDDGTASVATRAPAVSAGPSPASVGKAPKAASHAPAASPAGARAGKAAAPAGVGAGRDVPPPAPDPLAPRLRRSGTPPERQFLERELKRMKTRLVELETRIGENERAVKELEARMASPGFYDDRARAQGAADEHQKLMWETGDLMGQWEALQAEVDERSQQLTAATPTPRPAR
jgi:hypothetical protein